MPDINDVSPMMQNYLETKKQYSDCLLFYRIGDFYEMFFDDAVLVSKELELTLIMLRIRIYQDLFLRDTKLRSANRLRIPSSQRDL